MVAFYGTLLALVLAFAAMSKAPRERQADRASDDFVTHSISAPPAVDDRDQRQQSTWRNS